MKLIVCFSVLISGLLLAGCSHEGPAPASGVGAIGTKPTVDDAKDDSKGGRKGGMPGSGPTNGKS